MSPFLLAVLCAPDLNQTVGDTVKQSAGKQAIPAGNQPNFEQHENAFKYGYGARQHFAGRSWDDKLESELSTDFKGDWAQDRDYIRHSYSYRG